MSLRITDSRGEPADIAGMGLRFAVPPTVERVHKWARDVISQALRQYGSMHTHLLLVLGRQGILKDLNGELEHIPGRGAVWARHRRVIAVAGADLSCVLTETWRAHIPRVTRKHIPLNLGEYDLSNESGLVCVETRELRSIREYDIRRDGYGQPTLGPERTEGPVMTTGPMLGLVYNPPADPMPGLPGVPLS